MLRVAYDGSWFNNLDDTLVWDSPLRLDDSTSAPGRGRMALWPTNSAQTVSAARLHEVRAPDAAHRVRVVRILEQRPAAPAVHHQLRAAADRAAENHGRGRGARVLDQPEPRVASERTTGGSPRGSATTTTTTRRRTRRSRNYVTYDTSVGDVVDRRAGALRAQPHDFDADATWSGLQPVALTAGYTVQPHRLRRPHLRAARARTCFASRRDAVGTQWMTFHAKYEYGQSHGLGPGRGLCSSQIGEQPDMRHYDLANRNRNQFTGIVDFVPNDRLDVQRLRRPRQRQLSRQLFRPAGDDVPTVSFAADFQRAERPRRRRQLQLRALLRPAAIAIRGPEAQFNDPSRDWTTDSAENRQLLLDLRDAAEIRSEHRGARVVRLQLRRRQLPLRRRARRTAAAPRRSCRTCTTSCSSCTSTCGTGSRTGWR